MGKDTNKPSYPNDKLTSWQQNISTLLNGKIKKNKNTNSASNATIMTAEMRRVWSLIQEKKVKKNNTSNTGMVNNVIDTNATPEMKRLMILSQAKKEKKNTDMSKAATTGMTKNCMDMKVTNENKRDMNKQECECPICHCILIQNAAFIKHMKNHGIEKVGDINMRKKCQFCGLMIDKLSFNRHIQTQHREMYEMIVKQ